jgi:hypothetical protein
MATSPSLLIPTTLIKSYQRRLLRNIRSSPSQSNLSCSTMAPNPQRSLNNMQSPDTLSSETQMLSVRDQAENNTATTPETTSASVSTMSSMSMSRNLSRSTLAELSKREQADNSVSITKHNQLRVSLCCVTLAWNTSISSLSRYACVFP